MRKIINGKMYNSETATLISSRSYGNWGDFRHFIEELYRKKTGEFFIFGTGGPMSSYAVDVGSNSYSGSSRITPLDEDEAKEWLEMYGTADEYEACFGPMED